MNFKSDGASTDETKKREYLKQQHQLRTMTKGAAPLSADNMIETLLSKKEIFQKKTSQPEPSTQKPKVGPWPVWLTPGREPPLYKEIWKAVGSPNGLADTNKLSPLLMTSRLSTETLGYIWSLSNVTVPGCLTQQELYVALALVALAQSGYTFANSSVVTQLKEAPHPVLDLANFETLAMMPLLTSPAPPPMTMVPPAGTVLPPVQPSSANPALEPLAPSPVPTITENISLLDISHEPLSLIDSSPKKSLAVLSAMDLGKEYPDVKPMGPNAVFSDFQAGVGADDDFDDFKSADIFTADMNSLTVLDLTEPKEKKKAEPVKLDKGIDDLFPKCVVKPKTPDLISPSTPPYDSKESKGIQDFGILDDVPVLDPKNSSYFSPLRDTRVTNMKEAFEPALDLTFDLGLTGKVEGVMADLTLEAPGTTRETISLEMNPVGLKSPSQLQPSSLPNMSVPADTVKPPIAPMASVSPQEDKYSALRMLDSDLFSSKPSPSAAATPTDEFGDFLTADGPTSNATPHPFKDTDDDIQIKCLEACLKLLQEAASIFEAIEDSKVLNEVTSDERGKAYLQGILEVERIGRRIRSTREPCELISEFENLSKTLQPYIEYVKNNHLEEQDGPKCGICLCEHGPAHVKYGINHFHAPCANLYLQMVDHILPIAPVM